MNTRTVKLSGAMAGIAAIALSLPLAISAYAQPTESTEPPPANPVADLQGPGCDAFRQQNPDFKSLDTGPVGAALAAIPEVSTFNSAVSGQLNPAVNIVPVLENGPYVVFAPTDEAFAKLPPAQLDALKTDTEALSDLVYYHAFLGLLGPDDVKGQRPTQQGAEVKVTGKGGEITVNDTAKVLCGAIQAENARIYLIDTVLDPASPPAPVTPSGTSTTSATTMTTTTTTTTTSSVAATPAADAPIG